MRCLSLFAVFAIGCGGNSLSPYAGNWSGKYDSQNDSGLIRAKLGPDGSGVVNIDGLDYSVKAQDGEVSGRLIGRVQIEGVRLGFRLNDGGRVLYGFMEAR